MKKIKKGKVTEINLDDLKDQSAENVVRLITIEFQKFILKKENRNKGIPAALSIVGKTVYEELGFKNKTFSAFMETIKKNLVLRDNLTDALRKARADIIA